MFLWKALIIQSHHQYFMYSRKRTFGLKPFIIGIVIVSAFIADVIFSTSRFPVFTIIVCGIVTLYEIVSPFIYKAR
jgi:hypothetical protein